ncbi:MAG: hypothetical protein ACOX6E_00205 [Syntrophomonadaceae bacterium]
MVYPISTWPTSLASSGAKAIHGTKLDECRSPFEDTTRRDVVNYMRKQKCRLAIGASLETRKK